MLGRGALTLRLFVIAVSLMSAGCAYVVLGPGLQIPAVPPDQRCRGGEDDQRWLQEALASWQTVQRRFLKNEEHPLPRIVSYDTRCSYVLEPRSGAGPRWTVEAHGGEIRLPNGARIPAAPNAFNSVAESGLFVVISLPSIWRPMAPPSEIPLDWFLEGVLLHELAHSYQARVTPSVSFPALRSLHGNLSDDSVQDLFRNNSDYVLAYELERDLLFRAASAGSDGEARTLVCAALAKMRERRARYFTGASAHLASVDEISLTTEGLGQWVGYSWLTRRRGLAPNLVLSKLRGSYWSQDEGLAIFLAVDRLVPDWQRLLFAPSPVTAADLLQHACSS